MPGPNLSVPGKCTGLDLAVVQGPVCRITVVFVALELDRTARGARLPQERRTPGWIVEDCQVLGGIVRRHKFDGRFGHLGGALTQGYCVVGLLLVTVGFPVVTASMSGPDATAPNLRVLA